MKSKKSDCMPHNQIEKSVIKRVCKSHLRRQRQKREGTKSAFRTCYDRQACTFPSALSDKSKVDRWGIYHHLNSSDFSDDKQCGFYNRFQEKKNIEREKHWKIALLKSIPWKYDRYTEMWQEADLPKSLSTDCSLPLFVGHAKGRNVLYPIAKFAKRGHNLFLSKMRRISAR